VFLYIMGHRKEVIAMSTPLSFCDISARYGQTPAPQQTIEEQTGWNSKQLFLNYLFKLREQQQKDTKEDKEDALMAVIYRGVKAGAPPERYRAAFLSVLEALSGRGADYFILGCTELPLAFRLLGLSQPGLDPTEELARAAIRFCGYPLKN